MIQRIYIGLKTEAAKIKHTFAYWLTIVSAVLIPSLVFLIELIQSEKYIPQANINPWDAFFMINISLIASILFPFFVILTIALNLNIEHKADSWKKILLLPISRANIYFNKLIFLIIQVFAALVLFLLAVLVFGGILGLLHPELKFLEQMPNIWHYINLLLRFFMAIMGIFAIQFVMSLFFKNVIVPISAGLFGVVSASIIGSWKYAIYYPYAFSALFFRDIEKKNVDLWHSFSVSDGISVLVFTVTISVGYYLFRNKELK